MLQICFIQSFTDCYRGTLSVGEKVICDVLLPKKYPITFRGLPYKLEGVYKLNFTFADNYYSPCLIVNRRPMRLTITDEFPYCPEYPAPVLYIGRVLSPTYKVMSVPKGKWTLVSKELFATQKACKVTWNILNETETPLFEERKEEAFSFEDIWDDDEDDEYISHFDPD